jgi:hypothetical protein
MFVLPKLSAFLNALERQWLENPGSQLQTCICSKSGGEGGEIASRYAVGEKMAPPAKMYKIPFFGPLVTPL